MPKPGYVGAGWRKVRDYVLARDNYECRIRLPGCEGRATSADHIIPLDDGGARLDPLNLRAACIPCNSKRGNATKPRRGESPRPVGPSRIW